MKRTTLFLFCAMMLLSVTAWGQTGQKKALNAGDCFTGKTIEGDTFTISVLNADAMTAQVGNGTNRCMPNKVGKNVTLPSEYNGYQITHVSAKAFYDMKCNTLTLAEGIKSIGEQAFMYADLKIVFPSTLKTVESYAFRNSAIKEFNFPEGLESVGKWTVYASTGVEKIVVPSTVTKWGDEAFTNNGTLKEIVLNDGLKVLGAKAFQNCPALTAISLPGTLRIIYDYAFAKCSNLKTINFGEGLTLLGNYMFSECTGLEEVTIPGSLTSIGQRAFQNCTALNTIHWGEGLKQLGTYMFYGCSGLQSITVPASVTIQGNNTDQYIFANCTGLKSVAFEEGCTKVGQRMFDGCTALTTVTLPASVSTISSSAFNNCTSLRQLNVAEGTALRTFGSSAFNNCGFINLVLPEGLTSTGPYAFQGNTKLKTITLPSTLTSTDSYTFNGCSGVTLVEATRPTPGTCNGTTFATFAPQATLMVPTGAVDNYRNKAGWKEFRNIEEKLDLPDGTAFEGLTPEGDTLTLKVLSNTDKTCMIGDGNAPAPKHAINGKLTLPTKVNVYTVVGVAAGAFQGQKGITALEIPEGLQTLGANAFNGCSAIGNITLPTTLTTVGNDVFAGCTSIIEVTPKNFTPLTINDGFFSETTYENAHLFVPIGAKAAYQTANGWKKFILVGENVPVGTQFEAAIAEGPLALFEVTNSDTHTCKVINRGANTKPSVPITVSGTVTIPEKVNGYTVTAINDNAFYNQSTMTKVVLPATVQTIGANAFRACTALTGINLPEGITSLGNYTFYGCTALKNVRLPESLTTIGNSVFRNAALTRISIPAKVTSIGTYAFADNANMKSVTSYGQPATIKTSTFNDYASKTLHVEEGMSDTYKAAAFWSNFTSIDEAASGFIIDETLFPDEALRNKVKEVCGNKLTDDKNQLLLTLNLNNAGVKSLKGIELLEYLQELNIAGNDIDSIDLTNNTALQMLDCTGSQVKELKVAELSALRVLKCSNNEIETLNLTGLSALEEIYADSNKLKTLTIPTSPQLAIAQAAHNDITTFNANNSRKLEQLYLNDNQLSALSTSNYATLTTLVVGNNLIGSLGLNTNTALQVLLAANNKLTTLNVLNNGQIETLDIAGNQLKALNTPAMPLLKQFNAANNLFRALDFGKSTALESINLDGNNFTYVDLSACQNLTDETQVVLGNQTATGQGMYFIGLREMGAALHPYAVEAQTSNIVYEGNTIAQGKFNMVGTTPYLIFATDTDGENFNGKTFTYQYNAGIPNLTTPRMAISYTINNVATGINDINTDNNGNGDSNWYTLEGQKLNSRPAQSGIYIHDGKKVVIR